MLKMSVEREFCTNKEKELSLTPKILRVEHSTYQNKNEYPSNEPEILEVEFVTLLVTLSLSFVICAALTYFLVWVSSTFWRNSVPSKTETYAS